MKRFEFRTPNSNIIILAEDLESAHKRLKSEKIENAVYFHEIAITFPYIMIEYKDTNGVVRESYQIQEGT